MTEPTDVIAWKYANLFVADPNVGPKPGFVQFLTMNAVDWLRRRMDGIWVGGAVTLTNDQLAFGPNALNEAVHTGEITRAVRLADVTRVEERFGWLTRIVDVRTSAGETFTFRCFGTRVFAAQIREAAAVRRSKDF